MPELQEILERYGEKYKKNNKLMPHIHKTIRAIENCRTARLGGHEDL